MEEPLIWRHGGPEKSRPSRNVPRRQEKRTTPDPPRTPREQCGRKRARSNTEEREKLKGSHPARQSPQRRCAHSGEGQKHGGHQLAHGSGSLYRSSHRESKSPGDGRSSGEDPPCKRKRSQSRGRAFPAELGRWEKCSSSPSCYCCHATGDGGGKEFWHWAKDVEKLRPTDSHRSPKDSHRSQRLCHPLSGGVGVRGWSGQRASGLCFGGSAGQRQPGKYSLV